MRRTEILFAIILCGFGAFIATQALGTPRTARVPSVAPPAAARAADARGGADEHDDERDAAPGLTTTLRHSASVAPVRDFADIARRLRVSGPGTYIGEMLLAQDSSLQRWAERERPLYVWVQPSFGHRDWRPSYVDAASDGFSEWRSAGLPFDFTFVIDSSRADVHLFWTERMTQGRRIGMTYRVHDQHGWITGGHIVIAMQTVDGRPLPEPLIRATALHEAGHLVGLNHTTDSTSIMTSSASGRTGVGIADRATLRLLYSLPPGRVR